MGFRIVRRRTDDGAAAVEFALILIPFMILVLGMIQYGWYFFVSQSTGGAASNVVRRIQVGDCWGVGKGLALAQTQTPQVTSVSPNTIAANTPRNTSITITVTANAKIPLLLPLPNDGQVTKVVTARIEDTTASTAGCP